MSNRAAISLASLAAVSLLAGCAPNRTKATAAPQLSQQSGYCMRVDLPDIVCAHLPEGYEPTEGVNLVFPLEGENGIEKVNVWLRAEDWYPVSLNSVVWFGGDGTGNFLGWRPTEARAILWNPEDGELPWREGSVTELWSFILHKYADGT